MSDSSTHPDAPPAYITADQIADRLSYTALVEALREGFRSDVESPLRQVHETANVDDSKVLFLKPAWDDRTTPA